MIKIILAIIFMLIIFMQAIPYDKPGEYDPPACHRRHPDSPKYPWE